MKQQGKENKNSLRTPCTALNRGVCKFVGGADFLTTVLFWLQPRTERGNASNMLELHATLSMPNPGTHAYMHVSCIQKIFCQKAYSSLFLLACFDLGCQNSSLLKAEQPGSK